MAPCSCEGLTETLLADNIEYLLGSYSLCFLTHLLHKAAHPLHNTPASLYARSIRTSSNIQPVLQELTRFLQEPARCARFPSCNTNISCKMTGNLQISCKVFARTSKMHKIFFQKTLATQISCKMTDILQDSCKTEEPARCERFPSKFYLDR